MEPQDHKHENVPNLLLGFAAGLLIGGLAGAGAMVLLAPQSGEKTRAKLLEEGAKLRKQTVHIAEDSLKQIRTKAHHISDDVQEQAEDLQQRGQDMVDEQRDSLGTTLSDLGEAVHT